MMEGVWCGGREGVCVREGAREEMKDAVLENGVAGMELARFGGGMMGGLV